ncbi:MAG: hypothetical protein NZM07_01305 [Elioraea sp.]|nr:hypothetical protein [Elioraea sp.]
MVVRWIAAYRPMPVRDHRWLAEVEYIGLGRERAAEPLWRGRSFLLAECGSALVGLGYGPEAVVRAFWRDVWSEPGPDGRLVADPNGRGRTSARARRGWTDWDRFGRWWTRARPRRHGEVWLAARAMPCAVAHRAGSQTAAQWAAEIAGTLGLPVVAIRALEGDR